MSSSWPLGALKLRVVPQAACVGFDLGTSGTWGLLAPSTLLADGTSGFEERGPCCELGQSISVTLFPVFW